MRVHRQKLRASALNQPYQSFIRSKAAYGRTVHLTVARRLLGWSDPSLVHASATPPLLSSFSYIILPYSTNGEMLAPVTTSSWNTSYACRVSVARMPGE